MARTSDTAVVAEPSDVGLRERKKVRTRDTITEQALKLFRTKGYENTTLDEIADASEVHKRTLLRYFPTKTHLVLNPQFEELTIFEKELGRRGKQTVFEVWEEHVVRNSREYVKDTVSARQRLEGLRIAQREPAVQAAYLSISDRYRELIAAALHKELGDTTEGMIRSKVIAAALVGGNYAVGHEMLRRRSHKDVEATQRRVLDIVRAGLL